MHPNTEINDRLRTEILAYLASHPGTGRRKLARVFQISLARTQRLLNSLNQPRVEYVKPSAKAQDAPPPKAPEFDPRTGEASSTDLNIRTLEDLLRVCEVDTTIWRVKNYTINKWEVAMGEPATTMGGRAPHAEVVEGEKGGKHVLWTRGSHKANHRPLFQIKAQLERIPHTVDADEVIAYFRKQVEKVKAPAPFVVKMNKPNARRLLELSIPDLHIGKMAWHPETAHGHYDAKIAVSEYTEALNGLMRLTPIDGIDRILLPLGNDFFNVDNQANTTTAGTPQHEDVRWQKSFLIGCSLMVKTITDLTQVAPVDVVMVPGNHDYERAFYLGEYLRAWFRDHPQVSIDNRPTFRKYYHYHRTLLGFTHGDKEKGTDLPILMAREMPEAWAKTKWQEWHMGHLHTEKVREVVGVKIRHLPSLTPADAWHAGKGYVGNTRAAEAFLYDKERGLVANLIYNNDNTITE